MVLLSFLKTRRNRIVDRYLSEMVQAGVLQRTITNLHFAAAARYGQDNGGVIYPEMRDSIIFDKIIQGRNYSVSFLERHGNVYVTLTDRRSAKDIVADDADRMVAMVRAADKRRQKVPDSAWVVAIRDRAIESLQAGKRLGLKSVDIDDVDEFFEFYGTSLPVKKATLSDGGKILISVVRLPNFEPVIMYAVVGRYEAIFNAMTLLSSGVAVTDELLSHMREDIIDMLDASLSQMQTALEEDISNCGR